MTSVFVSHSSRDSRGAMRLAAWLRSQGHVSYFLDIDPEKGNTAGAHWETEIYRQLRLCRAVIALLSPHWLASRWCFAEAVQARALGKALIVLKIAPCRSPAILRDVQQIDATRQSTDAPHRLLRALASIGIDPLT